MGTHLIIIEDDKESQLVYKYLLTSKINFKPFIVRGNNVRERLKKAGITKIPALVLTNKKIYYESYQQIKNFVDKHIILPTELSEEDVEPSGHISEDIEETLDEIEI